MRIVLLIRDLDLGGAQRQMTQIAVGLSQRGHRVVVACWRPGGYFESRLGDAGIRIIALTSNWRGDIYRPAMQLRAILQAERTEVLYCLMPVENLIGLLATRATTAKIVWGIRTSAPAVRQSTFGIRVLFRVQRLLMRYVDAVVVNSAAGKDLCPSDVKSRVHVVRNGVDTEYFQVSARCKESTRRELGLESDAFVISVVGRIEAQKGVFEILDAFKQLSLEDPSMRLLIVGRVTEHEQARMAQKLQNEGLTLQVQLLPERSDIRSIYAASDLLVSASRGEGMSNVLAEAMASGVPVVSTKVGNAEEILGPNGWLVDSPDQFGLVNAIRAAVGSDLEEISVAARQRIITRYSVQRSIVETESVLEGVVR